MNKVITRVLELLKKQEDEDGVGRTLFADNSGPRGSTFVSRETVRLHNQRQKRAPFESTSRGWMIREQSVEARMIETVTNSSIVRASCETPKKRRRLVRARTLRDICAVSNSSLHLPAECTRGCTTCQHHQSLSDGCS